MEDLTIIKPAQVLSDGSTLEDRIDELTEKVEETNKLLKAMKRDALIGGVLKFVVWCIVIIVSYVTIVNYLTPLLQTFTGTGKVSPTDVNNVIDFYKKNLSQ